MRTLLLIKKKMNEEIIMSIRQGAFIREGRLIQSVVGEGFYYRFMEVSLHFVPQSSFHKLVLRRPY